MKFPDPNFGYLFGYKSKMIREGILVSFLGELVKILFKFKEIEHLDREVYGGGRISWNIIRWGKCPPGKEAIKIILKQGAFRNHIIVFNDLEKAICDLKSYGVNIE